VKVKYFLRGLGVGIVFTTMVLAFSTKNEPVVEMTDAQIVARAKTLGMMSAEEYDKKLDESLDMLEAEASTVPSVEPSASPTVAPSTTPTVAPTIEPTKEPDATKEPEVKPTKKPEHDETNVQEKTYISVEIQRGWLSNQVAEYLQKAGIIEDATGFDKYLCDNGFATKIRAGNYSIPKEAKYYDIAIMITNR
jgi:outer membrane biosynthesis protein TonB